MAAPFGLFERFGVELEYMLVDAATLAVRPIADQVLAQAAGQPGAGDVDRAGLTWSNELVLHVLELKTAEPAATLDGLAAVFQQGVQTINQMLAAQQACLLPTAMHPTMEPVQETRLWPHGYNEVYATFDRIFDCRGHGWANLQSVHLNLPFKDDAEFGKLHAAVRVLLPILPALSASSPVVDGMYTDLLDTRLEVYRSNARRIPSVAGAVIPEAVFTQEAYVEQILEPIYRDLAPHDPEGILQDEWVNARGAIARFERNTIEIRVLDVQECPAADLALVQLIVAVLRALVAERWSDFKAQAAWEVKPLERLLRRTIKDAGAARIDDPEYVALFGVEGETVTTVAQLWEHLFHTVFTPGQQRSAALAPVRTVLKEGCLARRMVTALGPAPTAADIERVYRKLAQCLANGKVFSAAHTPKRR